MRASLTLVTRAGRVRLCPTAVALFCVLLCAIPRWSGAEVQLSPVDRALPVFELQGLNGMKWNGAALGGKPWIINFWATWCGPCVHELPAMNRAAEQLVEKGVGMLAINVGERPAEISAFMQRVPIDFPVLLGSQKTFSSWSVLGLPTTFIVSAQGKIIAQAVGPREWDDAEFVAYMLALRD